ncbi:MAG: glycosyltransferase [Elainellaceae cyanobacterium]
MKIAFLVNEFPSLSETFILNQIVGLVEAGHQIDIYARNAQRTDKVHPLIEKHGLEARTYYHPYIPANYIFRYLKAVWLVVRWFLVAPVAILGALNAKRYGRHATSLKLLYRSIPLIRNGRPSYDAIMCHFGPMGLVALDLQTIGVLQGSVCVTFHGLDLSSHLLTSGKDVYNPLFAQGSLLLPISQFWEKRLIELGGSANSVRVHHMGIDTERFPFQPREFPKDGAIRIISIARLVEKKGIEYSIRALKPVVEQFPNLLYSVVGDGPLMPQLAQLVQELQLGDNVQLLGWQKQDDVVKLLELSHVMVAPSVISSDGDMEGIPVVLMEAMAMGLPVVSTWHSGIPELVVDGVSGSLVPERDVESLSQSILNLLHQSDRWPEIGRAGRQQVEAEFDSDAQNEKLITLLSER